MNAGREADLERALLKLIAGPMQDLADFEAIIESGADRELLREEPAPANVVSLCQDRGQPPVSGALPLGLCSRLHVHERSARRGAV